MICDARKPPSDIAGFDPTKDIGTCWYDFEAAERAVGFFKDCLVFIKGAKAGEPFILEKWQADVVRTLFGWKRQDATRRFRNAYIAVPRKNGKSSWIAGIAAYVLFADAEEGAECYCAASDREQASLVFRTTAGMIRKNATLGKCCKILEAQKRVVYGTSFLRAIPANEGGSHGFDSHLVIGDELHAWPGRDFFDVLHTSTGARTQPLEIYITTAGYDRESICFEVYDRARQIRDGKIKDETFLPVIYEAAEGDDWTLPATWEKANPNLGVSVHREYIERECQKAKENPAYENVFRRLHLNEWTAQESRWLPMDHWRACKTTEGELSAEFEQIGGLDLSAVADFTAWVRVQKTDTGLACRGHYFLPEEKAAEYARSYNLSIGQWVKDGWLTIVPGARIEHSYIHAKIKADGETHGVQTIGYDPWNMEQLRQTLEGDGFNMVKVRQGFGSLSGPSKELEGQVLTETLDHGNDPILAWMADNVVCKQDENGNLRPVKGKGRHKIDGIVALIMAIHALQFAEPPAASIFDTEWNL